MTETKDQNSSKALLNEMRQITPEDLLFLEDETISDLLHMLTQEQHRRALESGDTEALISEGFERGFNARGEAKDPWVSSGFLVCPGSKLDRSALSHECTFAHIEESWVWEAQDKILDEVRNIPGPRQTMRSVTLVLVSENMDIDMISSKMRNGVHQLQKTRSFTIKNGELELVSARAPKAASRHR